MPHRGEHHGEHLLGQAVSTGKHSYTARIRPADGTERHVRLDMFIGPVLDSGMAGARAHSGILTMRPDEADEFVELLKGRETMRLNRVAFKRAEEIASTIPDEEAMVLAKQRHDEVCKPDCTLGVTGSWLMSTRYEMAMERAKAELGIEAS